MAIVVLSTSLALADAAAAGTVDRAETGGLAFTEVPAEDISIDYNNPAQTIRLGFDRPPQGASVTARYECMFDHRDGTIAAMQGRPEPTPFEPCTSPIDLRLSPLGDTYLNVRAIDAQDRQVGSASYRYRPLGQLSFVDVLRKGKQSISLSRPSGSTYRVSLADPVLRLTYQCHAPARIACTFGVVPHLVLGRGVRSDASFARGCLVSPQMVSGGQEVTVEVPVPRRVVRLLSSLPRPVPFTLTSVKAAIGSKATYRLRLTAPKDKRLAAQRRKRDARSGVPKKLPRAECPEPAPGTAMAAPVTLSPVPIGTGRARRAPAS